MRKEIYCSAVKQVIPRTMAVAGDVNKDVIGIMNGENFGEIDYFECVLPLVKRTGQIIRVCIGFGLLLIYYLYKFYGESSAQANIWVGFIVISAGATSILPIVWSICGCEKITLSQMVLTVENKIWGIGCKKTYPIGDIQDVRLNLGFKPKDNLKMNILNLKQIAGINEGYITFRYKNREIKFGNMLSPEDAVNLIDMIESKRPIQTNI